MLPAVGRVIVLIMVLKQQTPDKITIFRLRVVTGRLKSILLDATNKTFWVQAQLVPDKGNQRGGHFYGNLVDIDDAGQTVAKMRVVIWRAEYEKIQKKLADDGQPDALNGNREICAFCSVRFHDVHGLQLQILDVDPNFGESHIDRNRRRILEKLQREGLLDKNRATVLPTAPLRIGLITSANSAAYADFTKTLSGTPYSFKIFLAAVTMQGQGTAREVVAAIKTLAASRVDVICLVRGGGSPLDLAWFDNEAIGRAIVGCPVPVWVGIGHEIDATMPDFVAHTRYKTPTAVAEALVERLRALDDDLNLSRDRLLEIFGRRIDLLQKSIVQDRNGLQQGVRKHLEIHSVRFLGRVVKLESTLDAVVSGRAAQLSECQIQLQERVRARMSIEDQSVANASNRFEDGVWRHLCHAEELNSQNLTGLLEGTRKYLAWKNERFQRWAVTLQGAIEKAFSNRRRLLDTNATLLEERVRGSQENGERNLRQRTSELLAVFDRVSDGRQNTLELKTSRFGVAQYDRILDQTLRNLEEKGKRLSALSPEQLLTRGYSITRDEEGRIIRSASQVQDGQTIHTQLAAGSLTSVVTRKEGSEDD